MAFLSYDVSDLGCLLQVGLRVSASYARVGQGGPPSSWTALVDTGAMRTAISPAVVRNLRPRPGDSVAIRRPTSGVRRSLIYDLELKFDGHLSIGRWFDLEVVAAQPATPGIDVLVGMDLLKQLHLYLSGPDGKLVLSY
jgi:predicted aspartyl protease